MLLRAVLIFFYIWILSSGNSMAKLLSFYFIVKLIFINCINVVWSQIHCYREIIVVHVHCRLLEWIWVVWRRILVLSFWVFSPRGNNGTYIVVGFAYLVWWWLFWDKVLLTISQYWRLFYYRMQFCWHLVHVSDLYICVHMHMYNINVYI